MLFLAAGLKVRGRLDFQMSLKSSLEKAAYCTYPCIIDVTNFSSLLLCRSEVVSSLCSGACRLLVVLSTLSTSHPRER